MQSHCSSESETSFGSSSLAEMIEKNAIVIQGNCFGFVLIPLDIAQLQNPLDYVHKAKISMDRKKRSLEAQCTFYILQLFLNLFGFRVFQILFPPSLHLTCHWIK